MKVTTRVFLLLALTALTLCAMCSYAAIGVYQATAGTSVPADISYTLNTDANDTTDGWSVKIEIVPALGGPAVRTWKFTYPHENTLKGEHVAVTWNGKDDFGVSVPDGDYKAIVTAKAAPVTGSDLVPLWEYSISGNTSWNDVAVNTNPGSPYYGYVYATNHLAGAKGVYMFKPTGEFVKKFDMPADNWDGSAPWGVAVGDDDHVWASSYSRSFLIEYHADGSNKSDYFNIGAAYNGFKNPRFIDVTGTGGTFRAAATYWTPQLPPATYRFYSQSGYPPAAPWTEVSPITEQWNLMECKFGVDGNLVVPAYGDPGATTGGALVKLSMAGTVIGRNDNIKRGTGFTFSADGNYMWISRFVTGSGSYVDSDATPIYKIPTIAAFSDDPGIKADPYATPALNVEKFGIANSATAKRAYSIDADGVGNLVACTGHTALITANPNCVHIGVYAPPDNGSQHAASTGIISWTEPLPHFDGSNAPQSVSSCNPASAAYVEVTVSDLDGYTDIQRCYLDLSPFGQADHTPMNVVPGSGSGTTVKYFLNLSVPDYVKVGEYDLTVYMRDVHHPNVPETTGTYKLIVTGGWISGKITNAVTGWPIEGATVTATGPFTFTALTDADGNYTMAVNPGTYAVDAEKTISHNKDTNLPAVTAVVTCGATATNINYTLQPLTVRQTTGGQASGTPGRPSDEPVSVVGTVLRTHYDAASSQNGLNGYYYIYDTSYAGTVQSVKVLVYAGQAPLNEGDKVVVDGTWTTPYGFRQGHVVPSRAPYVVATGQALPTPTALTATNMLSYTWGRLFSASGIAKNVVADGFDLEIAPGSTVTVRADTPATTGITMPGENAQVDIRGLNVYEPVIWSTNIWLLVSKPADVSSWAHVNSLNDIKYVANGNTVVLDVASGAVAPVVTYIDPNELGGIETGQWCYVISKDRATGLKISTADKTYPFPSTMTAGDEITRLVGTLSTTSGAHQPHRQLVLKEVVTIAEKDVTNIPPFLTLNGRAFGGAWTGATAGVSGGIGLNTEGLLVRMAGKCSGYGITSDNAYEYFYLDDGSGIECENGYKGIKVYRSLNLAEYDYFPSDGDMVIVQGIATSEWSSAAASRIPVLKVRTDSPGDVYDETVILQ